MPQVAAKHIDRLIAAFNPVEGRAICIPTWQGRQGNLVVWARRFFADIMTLSGDRGAKALIEEHNVQVAEVRSEEHTSELQSLMRISYAVFCLNKKKIPTLQSQQH